MGSLVAARSACHSPWHMGSRLPVSGVEGPSREIAASRQQKQKIAPTHGSFSATNEVLQVVKVTSPERVARNLTWTVGLSLSRARAPKLPKQATDRPCIKASGAPIARQPESPFPFPCITGSIERRNQEKTASHAKEKSAVLPEQCTVPQVHENAQVEIYKRLGTALVPQKDLQYWRRIGMSRAYHRRGSKR